MGKKSLIAVGMSAMLLLTAIGGVTATAPTLDTETTDTALTTELDGTSTQTHNTTTTSFLNTSQDSNQTTAEIRQGADGRLLATYGLNSSDNLNYETVASGTYYHTLELADDGSDYPGLEADAGEDVEIEVRSINTADDPDTMTNTTFTFSNDANVSFINYNASETQTADRSFVAQASTGFGILGDNSSAGPAKVQQDIGVNGENQEEINVHVANADAQDSVAEVYNDSDDADGVSYMALAKVDGEIVPVMAEGASAPDWVDSSDDAYMTVSEDGQSATVHNAGAVIDEGDSEATVSLQANEAMGFSPASTMFENYDRSSPTINALVDAGVDINGEPNFEDVEA